MKNRRLVFRAGTEYYAVMLEPVIEIVGRTKPLQDEHDQMIIQVRQDQIPCFKMPWKLDGNHSIICQTPTGLGAIVVDEVCGIFRNKDYTRHPPPLSLSRMELQSFFGIIEIHSLNVRAYELNFEEFLKFVDPHFKGIDIIKVQKRADDTDLIKSGQSIIEIPLGNQTFAGLSVNYIERIIPFRKPSPIAGLPDFALGLINVEGSIVPLIDLNSRITNVSPTEGTRIVVMVADRTKWGLSVPRISTLKAMSELSDKHELDHPMGYWLQKDSAHPLLILNPSKLVGF